MVLGLRRHAVLATLVAAGAVAPARAAAPTRDPAADRCTVGLLGVGGELVSGIGLVDAGAYASGLFPNRAKAVETAKSDARRLAQEQLRGKVCAGLADADCSSELGSILGPVEQVFDDRYACVVVGVEARVLGNNTASGRASRALTSLGQSVRASLGKVGARGTVALDVVRNVEGCSAVGLEGVRQQVAASLAAADLDVLAPDAPVGDAWTVALEATRRGADVQVAARLVDPSDPSGRRSRPVEHVAVFPAAAFGEVSLDRGCVAPVKPRAGRNGLRARLEMPTRVCAGETFHPSLEVSAPARVQVWSVAPDGSAMLLVPGAVRAGSDQRDNGNWTGKRPLMELTALPVATSGDELILAVALPYDAPVSAGALPPNCKVARFDASRIPDDAAVAVHSWRVQTDPGHCPRAPEMQDLARKLDVALARVPDCP